jgi:hypothetical protein
VLGLPRRLLLLLLPPVEMALLRLELPPLELPSRSY